MVQLIAGKDVTVITADGMELRRVAITGIVAGHDFPVVWVCKREEMDRAKAESRSPTGVPWPSDAVRV